MNGIRKTAIAFVIASTLCNGASARPQLAPADEYFGLMKMSVLEIGNRLSDLDRRSSSTTPAPDANVLHDAHMTEDAIRDWQRKYPADPWLPKDLHALAHIYARYHGILARHITH